MSHHRYTHHEAKVAWAMANALTGVGGEFLTEGILRGGGGGGGGDRPACPMLGASVYTVAVFGAGERIDTSLFSDRELFAECLSELSGCALRSTDNSIFQTLHHLITEASAHTFETEKVNTLRGVQTFEHWVAEATKWLTDKVVEKVTDLGPAGEKLIYDIFLHKGDLPAPVTVERLLLSMIFTVPDSHRTHAVRNNLLGCQAHAHAGITTSWISHMKDTAPFLRSVVPVSLTVPVMCVVDAFQSTWSPKSDSMLEKEGTDAFSGIPLGNVPRRLSTKEQVLEGAELRALMAQSVSILAGDETAVKLSMDATCSIYGWARILCCGDGSCNAGLSALVNTRSTVALSPALVEEVITALTDNGDILLRSLDSTKIFLEKEGLKIKDLMPPLQFVPSLADKVKVILATTPADEVHSLIRMLVPMLAGSGWRDPGLNIYFNSKATQTSEGGMMIPE